MSDTNSEQYGEFGTENIRKEQDNREPSAYGSTDSDDLNNSDDLNDSDDLNNESDDLNNSDDSDDSDDSIDPKELKKIARFYKAQKRKLSLSQDKCKHVQKEKRKVLRCPQHRAGCVSC